jgi:predicted tellurium resistance membrane protein TerC
VTRILFLLGIGVIVGLTEPFAHLLGADISGRALILIIGGAFLIFKATKEIHDKLEGEEATSGPRGTPSFNAVIGQILVIDLVFSIDSVITAVGMVKWIEVMIAAVVVSVGFMLWFAGSVSRFVESHPTIKMLALAFLLLIGANLVAEGLGHHIPKGYTYFAMAFSLGVELLNIRIRRKKHTEPVHLRSTIVPPDARPE